MDPRADRTRVHALNAYFYRKNALDAPILARSRAALERALEGGKELTRHDPRLRFGHHLIVDGRLAGSWRRTLGRGAVLVDVATYRPLSRAHARALDDAAERYGRFMNSRVTLSVRSARRAGTKG